MSGRGRGGSGFLLIFHRKNLGLVYVFESLFACPHTHAGFTVNVTSCSTASEWPKLCLNQTVMWPPPQLHSPLSSLVSWLPRSWGVMECRKKRTRTHASQRNEKSFELPQNDSGATNMKWIPNGQISVELDATVVSEAFLEKRASCELSHREVSWSSWSAGFHLLLWACAEQRFKRYPPVFLW